jgi:outer membrane protein assembly factor BamB
MVETQKFPGEPKRPQGNDATLQIGSVLNGRYRIQGVLGVGGMGSVYLARDMNFPEVVRHVAVKEMLYIATDAATRETYLKNFEREAGLLAELSHPAIPKIHDRFSIRDRAYLIMEYINGRDLETILNQVPDFLPFDMVRKWTLELCDVLTYLHNQKPEPIVFRDMKPSNVMIDAHGNVRLIDFGIAKKLQNIDAKKGTQIGTEGYSPPEQYRGESTTVGDIYALGATIHHLLTKRDPRIESPFSWDTRPIAQINPNVPEDFARVIDRALAYNPSDRYQSAGEMKAAIEATMAPKAPVAIPARAGGGSAPGTGPRAQIGASMPGGTQEWAEEGLGQLVWKHRCEDEIRAAPLYYRNVVYVGVYDNNLYAINSADGSFVWKYPTEGGIATAPSVVPELNIALIASEDRSLHAVHLGGDRAGRVAWTTQTNGPIRSTPMVQHGHAFFGSDDGHLYAARILAEGRISWKKNCNSAVRSRPAVTEDRIIVGTDSGEVIAFDLAGEVKWRCTRAKRAVLSSPVVHEQIVYYGSLDAHLYAVDVKSGFVSWRTRFGGSLVGGSLIIGRTLYIGCADGHMYALDLSANGRVLWRFRTDGQIVSTPAFANGAIYFGSADGHVYCVDIKKGQLRWKYETSGPITSSPCIPENSNVLYIGSNDCNLYALRL